MPASNKIQVGYIEAQDGAQFEVDAGTAAAPGLCFDNSAATGLYSPGTGQIAWSTSGKQTALRILADGKVGVDCSPTVALEVNGTIKASAIDAPIEGTLDDWIVHAGDTNTKLGFPANDQFSVETGGSQRLLVQDAGAKVTGTLELTDALYWDGDTDTTIDNAAGTANWIRFKTGGTTVMDITSTNDLKLHDNRRLKVGASDDIQIFHNSGNNRNYFFSPQNNVYHEFNVANSWTVQTTAGDKRIECADNSTSLGVDLYHNGSMKLRTTSSGVNFTGTDFGFNTTPGGNPAGKAVFLAIGDSDTGIVQDGDGQLEIWANDNEVVHFNAIDGYVSTKPITTTGAVQTGDLTILNGNPDLRLKDSNHGGNNTEHIITFQDSSGNNQMNIGSPFGEQHLRIKHGTTNLVKIQTDNKVLCGNQLNNRGAVLQIEDSNHAQIGIHRNTADHGAPAMNFSASRGTSAGANDLVQNNDYLGMIRFSGADGSDLADGAYITGIVDGTAASNKMPTRIGFWTSDANSQSPTERLRIDKDGRLLIGTQKTYSSATWYDDITINNSNGSGQTGGTGITLISSSNSWGSIYLGDSDNHGVGAIKYDHNTNHMRFVVNGVDPAAVITNGGCLSLGTASPGQPNVPGIHIQSDEGDDCRIAFVTTNKANTRIGYFGLSNRFGVDVHNGFQIRDAGSSYATRILIGSNGNMGVGTDNTNSRVTISSGSSANAISIRNTTGGNGNVGILFSTQDHSGGREKAAIYHQETHGQAHYGGDFVFCLNTATGGATQVSPSDERFRIRRNGFVDMVGSSDVRFTLGTSGTAGTNDSNWIRGEGANIMYNAASANHIWETGGAKQMEISAGNLFLRSSGTTRYIVLGSAGDSTSGGANNSMNWIRSNNTNVQYNNAGGFHGWEVSGSEKFRINSNGSASLTGSLSQNTSDDRLKKDKVEILNALDKVNSLSSFTHKWNDIAVRAGLEENKEEVGLSAQEVQSIHPSLVDINITIKDPEDPTTEYLTIHYHKVVPLLVASIKELTTKNETLEARIAALESSINN